MALTTGGIVTGTSGLDSTRLSPIFQKKFLQTAISKLCLADIAEQFDLPKNAGSLTMRFFRRAEATAATAAANVRAVTEGTPLTQFSNTTIDPVEVSLLQYGDQAKITDTRQMTDIIKQLDLEATRMGEEAAIHLDTQIRDALWSGTGSIGATAAQVIDKASSTTSAGLAVLDLDKAVTILTENRAPTFAGGCYIAVVSPRQAYELRRDADWKNVATYSDKERIYNGEIGKIFNVKVVIGTNPKTHSYTNGSAKTGETAIVLGRECAGTIKLAGTNSPMAPQLIYNDKPDKSDPMNLFNIVAWKAWYASMCLNPKFGVLIKTERNAL